MQETGRPIAQVPRDLRINQYTLAGSGGNGGGALSKSSKGSGVEGPLRFPDSVLMVTYAACCRLRYSVWTSRGVRYPIAE